mgnify:CR=1 FL=1
MLSERVIGKKSVGNRRCAWNWKSQCVGISEAGADVAISDINEKGWKRLLSILESLVEKHWSCQLT